MGQGAGPCGGGKGQTFTIWEEKSARLADGFDMECGREGGGELKKSSWFQV